MVEKITDFFVNLFCFPLLNKNYASNLHMLFNCLRIESTADQMAITRPSYFMSLLGQHTLRLA